MNEKRRFVVDAMLGSLARKLRLFGFDTLYFNNEEDEHMLEVSIKEERTLLTSDRELFKRAIKLNAKSMLLEGDNDIDNLASILSSMDVKEIKFVSEDSRCPLCNGMLEKYEGNLDIPLLVRERQKRFYVCIKCNKAYWEGSHLRKLREFERRVNSKLASIH